MELTQTALIEKLIHQHAKNTKNADGKPKKPPETPLPHREQLDDLVSDGEFEQAKDLPYPSVVCVCTWVFGTEH